MSKAVDNFSGFARNATLRGVPGCGGHRVSLCHEGRAGRSTKTPWIQIRQAAAWPAPVEGFGWSGRALPVAAGGVGRVPLGGGRPSTVPARRAVATLRSAAKLLRGAMPSPMGCGAWLHAFASFGFTRHEQHGPPGRPRAHGARFEGAGPDGRSAPTLTGYLASERRAARVPTPTRKHPDRAPGPSGSPGVPAAILLIEAKACNWATPVQGEGTAPRSSLAAERKGATARLTGTVLGRSSPRGPVPAIPQPPAGHARMS